MGIITWNGVASNTLGIMVEKVPNYNGTKRRYETVSVAGRNGSLLFDLGSYENIVQEYEIALIGNGPTAARTIREWLLGTIGYAKLSDSYDSGYFYNAYFDGPVDVENVLNEAGRATIRFVCGPERYLNSGETDVTVPKYSQTTTLTNIYSGDALPLFIARNTSGTAVSGTISFYDVEAATVNEIQIANWSQGQNLYIDSLLKDAYNASNAQNDKITLTDGFPVFYVGHSYELWWSGSLTSVVVRPRWWTL